MTVNNHPKDSFQNVRSWRRFIVMVSNNIKLFKSQGLTRKKR